VFFPGCLRGAYSNLSQTSRLQTATVINGYQRPLVDLLENSQAWPNGKNSKVDIENLWRESVDQAVVGSFGVTIQST
jgi:hypothetical protein